MVFGKKKKVEVPVESLEQIEVPLSPSWMNQEEVSEENLEQGAQVESTPMQQIPPQKITPPAVPQIARPVPTKAPTPTPKPAPVQEEVEEVAPVARILAGELLEGGLYRYTILTNKSIGQIGELLPLD